MSYMKCGVISGDLYKIYGKSQSQMAQKSCLGVALARDLTISSICQADGTLLVSNNLNNLQNLLQLTLYYCPKFNVELYSEKTVLQVFSTKKMRAEVDYLKEFSPIILNGLKLEFSESTEHVGIVRATSGNLPNIVNRISSHKKAVALFFMLGLLGNTGPNLQLA